jgi:GNAT superfamily N-acetyltransferase
VTRIVKWIEQPGSDAARAAVERIFFAASGTQAFSDAAARLVFRDRWLDRYFDHDPGLVFLALDDATTVVGYLVGSLDDPALAPRFADIGYFAAFAPLTARYPAQLHVNLDASSRGGGIGAALVEAFVAEVVRARLPGVHVVTGRGVRNVRFYERSGFLERGSLESNGRAIVFLGRDVAG